MGRKVKRWQSKDPQVVEQLRYARASAGLERKQHFAAGKDLESWRPRRKVEPERRREANKKACRGKVRWEW